MISIKGLNKAAVLAALYNASKPLGMGFLHYTPEDMTIAEAASLLVGRTGSEYACYFDYLKGRVMKVNLTGDDLDPRLYDRDNGDGACQNALLDLLTTPGQ